VSDRRVGGVVAVLVVLSLLGLGQLVGAAAGPGAPDQLTVDGLTAPIGIDDTPAFAWRVHDERRGAVQSAYRIVVRGVAGQVWDSGRVRSADQAFVAYRGPSLAPDTRYSWTVETWAADDTKSPPSDAQSFDTGLRDADWQAQWVRRAPTGPVDAADDYTYARRELRVSASPIVRAVAYLSADQQFQLVVNGTGAGAGEAFGYPDGQYYQAVDVRGLLRPGASNAVGVLYHWSGVWKGRPAGAPGLIVRLVVEHADGTRELLVTDATWKVQQAPWLPSTGRNQEGDPVGNVERIDGTRQPIGWADPGFDDRLWSAATAVGRHPTAPWTHLVSERTRIVEEPIVPARVTTLSNGSIVADFGRVIAARPTVTFRTGVPGRVVNMRAGFLLEDAAPMTGQVSSSRGNQHTDMSYSYVERLGAQTFASFEYLGFRYLQIDAPGEAIGAGQIVAMARHAAVPDAHAATLTTSNPAVDAVFELARHSALFGSQEQFIDTPTREKGPFLRDSYNISEVDLRAFGEQNLSRRALVEFAESQTRYWPDGHMNAIYPSGEGKRDIPDFTEIYPEWVWQYELATGDRDLVVEVYPVLSAIADYVARAIDPKTGLVTNLPGGDGDYQYGIVDWPKSMRYGYDMATTARTTVNMLGVDVFDRVARLAASIGRPAAEQEKQQQRRDALGQAINTKLRRADGVYIDGLRADGTPSAHASQHANAYALAYGIAPDRPDVVSGYVAGLGMSMGPQTAQLLLEALHDSGRDADLVRVVTDAAHDGWANVIARGGTFTWETWQPSDANGDSMSHGWGSTVLVALQESVLGVTPTAPGFASFDVRPPTGGATRAEGRVPAPAGPITASWSRPATSSGAFEISVTVPANTVATVEIPATAKSGITEGGAPLSRAAGVRFDGIKGDLAMLAVGAGTYHFRSTAVPAGYVGVASARPATVVAAPGRFVLGAPVSPAPGSVAPSGSTGSVSPPLTAAHHGRSRAGWLFLAGACLLVVLSLIAFLRRRATPATRR
jgi:alpha-L-rhamnosidase